MLRTSSKLLHAQRVHLACRIYVHKGNVRHVTARKVGGGGDFFVQLYGRSALIAPINGTVVQRSCDVHN